MALNNQEWLIWHKTNTKPNKSLMLHRKQTIRLKCDDKLIRAAVPYHLTVVLLGWLIHSSVILWSAGFVLWHINPYRLFNAKSCIYIYIYIYIYTYIYIYMSVCVCVCV